MSAPSVPCLLLAAAAACWPGPAVVVRLHAGARPGAADGARTGAVTARLRRAGVPRGVPAVAAIGLGVLTAGPAGALCAGALAFTVARVRAATRAESARAAAAGGLADALASFAAEVRAGAPASSAAESSAADAHPAAARALARVAATARLGGDVPSALRVLARAPDAPGGEHLDRLAGAWSLADRHGVALAGPVAAVATDLRARARVAGRLSAQLAGPRATAAVLAALPVLGVLLGEGIGARPWSVLTGTGLGQVLLVVGVGLVCAGVLWTAHITARVTR